MKKQTPLQNENDTVASYAVLVLRPFTERVQGFFGMESTKSYDYLVMEPPPPSLKECGKGKSRYGYHLLLIFNTTQSPKRLSCCARKQISWVAQIDLHISFSLDIAYKTTTTSITTRTTVEDKMNTSSNIPLHNTDIYNDLSLEIYHQILQIVTSNTYPANHIHKIRFDCFPKELGEIICHQVEQRYNQCNSSMIPLQLTKSAQHATLIVTVVKNITHFNHEFYTGISTPYQHFHELNHHMNDYASNQMRVIPPDTYETCHADIPVSRAYYKLKEVCEDYFSSSDVSFIRSQSTAIDVGASPGGWTQVLKCIMGISKVICIDPGIVSKRVTNLDGVIYVCEDVRSNSSTLAMARYAPFPLLVCDASMDNYLIFQVLEESLSLVHKALGDKPVLTLPSFVVITLKFAYKTEASIQRNLQKAMNALPDRIASLIPFTSPLNGNGNKDCVNFEYKVIHLMANSSSERTVLIKYSRNETV